MTEQAHETFADALIEVVKALGGSKKVGAAMRSTKEVDEAARWVRDCLNPERRERFEPEDVLFLLREGRRVGCHAAMHHLAGACGYAAPVPVAPVDEVAELQRQFIEMAQRQERMYHHLVQLGAAPALKAVA